MKRCLTFFAFILLLQPGLHAQQLYFPRANYKDSTALAASIPRLAAEVLTRYKEANKPSLVYFDNMRRYALAAKYYGQSISYLDSVRKLSPSVDTASRQGIGIQWEVYARTEMRRATEPASFSSVFTDIFSARYNRLDGSGKALAAQYISIDLPSLTRVLDKLKEKARQSDSISLADAGEMISAYNAVQVYTASLKIMQQVIAAADQREFIIGKELIKVRDGSLLQAVIVRKRELKGRLPAVFVFNIYADSSYDQNLAKRYALKGFAAIVANTRGKAGSPQDIEPFEHDAKDAYDIIDWISKQKWSNGKVGMVGGSYLGFSQWAAAKTVHPALRTIMPQVAVGIGIDYPMNGNVFMTYMLRWIHYVTNNKGTDNADFADQERWHALFAKWYREGTSFRSIDSLDGRPSTIFQRWLQHPAHDRYWQDMVAYGDDFSKIKIPVLTTTGYFDDDQNGAMYYYRQHFLHNPAADHYLVIGPYSHFGAQKYPEAAVMGYDVDSVATSFNFVDLSVQWFNYILKNGTKPALLQDKVNYEVMGANTWEHAPSLKAMSNGNLRFYISNIRSDAYYKLVPAASAAEYIRQEADLADRSDTTRKEFGVIDSTIPVRNVISFISRPFEQPLRVNGAFTAQLQLAVNKKDIDIVVKLYELMPDGRYFDLGAALQRASYARDRSRRILLQPGVKESIPVTNAFMTSRQLSKGSRLVVLIGVNKSPDWQINYGTGKDVSDETIKDAQDAMDIKWFSDSYIDIPVWQ